MSLSRLEANQEAILASITGFQSYKHLPNLNRWELTFDTNTNAYQFYKGFFLKTTELLDGYEEKNCVSIMTTDIAKIAKFMIPVAPQPTAAASTPSQTSSPEAPSVYRYSQNSQTVFSAIHNESLKAPLLENKTTAESQSTDNGKWGCCNIM